MYYCLPFWLVGEGGQKEEATAKKSRMGLNKVHTQKRWGIIKGGAYYKKRRTYSDKLNCNNIF